MRMPRRWCVTMVDAVSPCTPCSARAAVPPVAARSWVRTGSLFPMEGGHASQCHPYREPCCSDSGWCGSTREHCTCDGCVDYSPKDDGAWAEFGESRSEKVESLIPSPHRITWDGRQAGEIMDGGGDMYGFPPFGGNRISTSLCKQSRLAPFGDNFELQRSDCFGDGGSVRMDLRHSMLVLITKNEAPTEVSEASRRLVSPTHV